MAARAAKAAATGKKPGGTPPAPPVAGPGPTDQVNPTNEDDKQQVEPMLGRLGALPTELGQTETLLADTG